MSARFRIHDQIDDGRGGTLWVRDWETGNVERVPYSSVTKHGPSDREDAYLVAVGRLRARANGVETIVVDAGGGVISAGGRTAFVYGEIRRSQG